MSDPDTKCGRRICAWHPGGPIDLGPAPGIAEGLATHGMCPDCERRVARDVVAAGGVVDMSREVEAPLARERRAGCAMLLVVALAMLAALLA